MQRRKVTYQLYPTAKQSALLLSLLHAHKNLWNAALEERIDAWRKARKSIRYEDQCQSLTMIREAMPGDWATMNCSSQQVTLRRLDKAFQNFFRRVAAGQTPGFPRFKSINRMPGLGFKGHGDGWRFTPKTALADGKEDWKHGVLRLQGIGHILARGRARQGGKIKSCELLHQRGNWMLSLTVECEKIERVGGACLMTGDWGVEHLITLVKRDGVEHVENPRWFTNGREGQAALERDLARKKRGSARRRAAAQRLAAFRAKVARQRLDHHHKLAARIAAGCYAFGMEKLTVSNMTRSAKGTIEEPGSNVAQKAGLNREILDTAPSLLMKLIAYKVEETGGQFMEAPTKKLKPSQTCPACGRVEKKRLSQRLHKCSCGCAMQRDHASGVVVLDWLENEFAGQELLRAA